MAQGEENPFASRPKIAREIDAPTTSTGGVLPELVVPKPFTRAPGEDDTVQQPESFPGGIQTRSKGPPTFSGELPPYRQVKPKAMAGEQEIKALTDSFKNLAATLTEAPASGPLLSIEKFDPSKLSARDWMRDFKEASALSKWSDVTRFVRFPFYLASGAARHWFTLNKATFTDYQTLKTAFLKEFVPEDETWVNLEKLRLRKFRPQDENLVAYYYAVSDLCYKVDTTMSDQIKVHYLLGGVDPHLRNHLALLDLKTPQAVLSKFKVLKVDVATDGKSVVLAISKSEGPMDTPPTQAATAGDAEVHSAQASSGNEESRIEAEVQRRLAMAGTPGAAVTTTQTFTRGGRGRGGWRGNGDRSGFSDRGGYVDRGGYRGGRDGLRGDVPVVTRLPTSLAVVVAVAATAAAQSVVVVVVKPAVAAAEGTPAPKLAVTPARSAAATATSNTGVSTVKEPSAKPCSVTPIVVLVVAPVVAVVTATGTAIQKT